MADEKSYRLSEADREEILELAKKRMMLKDIASQVGRNVATVRLALKKAGVEPYWRKGMYKEKQQRHPFNGNSHRVISLYGGFTSTKTGAHYFITKGQGGKYFLTVEGITNHGMISVDGHKTHREARETLAYLKSLIESEKGVCIDDVQNR